MALNDAVPSSATDVFKRNAEDVDRLLNSTGNVTTRTGKELPSWDEITKTNAAWNNRGAWTTATAYAVNDIWESAGVWYAVLTPYTSGATVDLDISGGNVAVLNGNFGSAATKNTDELVTPVNSVADLAGFAGTKDDQQISLKGWHPDSDVGGGILYWDAAKPKSEHNGGTIFSPTVPFSVTTGDYLDGEGETDAGGSGCWVKKGRFVYPEMFGAVGTGTDDDYVSVQATLDSHSNVLLATRYGLSRGVTTTMNGQVVAGINREQSQLVSLQGLWSNSPNNAPITMLHDNCVFKDFTADANNVGSAPSDRTNACKISGSIGFSVVRVDALNATGYAHVAFGNEMVPETSGYYSDCRAENSQVLFEQLACNRVTLYSCTGVATERTVEGFHPYASVKEITYINCKIQPRADVTLGGTAGINIVSVGGLPLGRVTFIDCDVYVNGTGSAVAIDAVSGNIQFIGGSYISDKGASLVAGGAVEIDVNAGAKFSGKQGFNCSSDAGARVSLSSANLQAEKDQGGTAAAFALVTNGCPVSITGGSLEAVGPAGSAAILGAASVSNQTSLSPPVTGGRLSIVKEGVGSVVFTNDGGNAFANIVVNWEDLARFSLQLSVHKQGVTYPAAYSLNWKTIDVSTLRVYAIGLDSTYTLFYRWVLVE